MHAGYDASFFSDPRNRDRAHESASPGDGRFEAARTWLHETAGVCPSSSDARDGIPLAVWRRKPYALREYTMLSWISCYVTGHDYSVCCEQGRIFLRCVVCGRRSEGVVVCSGHAHAQHH